MGSQDRQRRHRQSHRYDNNYPWQDLRDAKDKMPVGNLLEHLRTQPLTEFRDPFLMAGRTKMAARAGEGKQVLVSAIFAFYAGEAIVQISAIEIAVDDLQYVVFAG
jgi:hypothetical protein